MPVGIPLSLLLSPKHPSSHFSLPLLLSLSFFTLSLSLSFPRQENKKKFNWRSDQELSVQGGCRSVLSFCLTIQPPDFFLAYTCPFRLGSRSLSSECQLYSSSRRAGHQWFCGFVVSCKSEFQANLALKHLSG